MVFNLSSVERGMILQAIKRIENQAIKNQIAAGYILANTDGELKQLQKKVTLRADLHYANKKFPESKRYMEIAMRIRDMRTRLAKARGQNGYDLHRLDQII